MNDETANPTPSDRVGFCQNCGKALNKETIRVVGSAVYCEPCLEAKLAGVPPYNPGYGYPPVDPTTTKPQQAYPGAGPIIPGAPNPALAALLGLIPGVGAMYNEQYAKAIAHLVIFAVLGSLSHTADIFGLFVFAWVVYMSIDAHHTARARRDGTPLPNPFGLNDIGERMGFARTWHPPTTPAYTPPPTTAASETPATEPNWGAPTDRATYAPSYNASYPPLPPLPPLPPFPPYGASGSTGYPVQASGYGTGYGASYGAGYGAGYDPGVPPIPTNIPSSPRGSFPAGAIWLIAFGALFLIGNSGIFRGLPASALVGAGMIVLSGWVFFRKMTDAGHNFQDDGSPMYRVRVLKALRGSVWVLLFGVLLLLTSLHIIEWSRSWPYFIILAGVMAILERTAYNTAAAQAYQYPPAAPYPGYPGPASVQSGTVAPAPEKPATPGEER